MANADTKSQVAKWNRHDSNFVLASGATVVADREIATVNGVVDKGDRGRVVEVMVRPNGLATARIQWTDGAQEGRSATLKPANLTVVAGA